MASAEFESAVASIKALETDPGNETKLRLYGLFKQATAGYVSGSRPGMMNLVGRAKYDAWSAVSGTSAEDAEAQYVAIARALTTP